MPYAGLELMAGDPHASASSYWNCRRVPLCPAPPRHLDTYSLLSFPPPDGMPFLLLSCLHASHPCLGLQRAELKKGTFRRRKCGSDRLVLGQWTSSSSSLFPQVGNEDICSQNSSIGMNKLWLLDTQESLNPDL